MPKLPEITTLARNHVRFGWLALAVYATIGIMLEAFHGFKSGWYLEEAYETRRLLFTLGHAHGALLSIVNVLFGLAGLALGGAPARLLPASRLLTVATVLLPCGFLLGGFAIYGSDPGVGIYLVPIGAVAAVAAFLAAGAACGARQRGNQTVDLKEHATALRASKRKPDQGRRQR